MVRRRRARGSPAHMPHTRAGLHILIVAPGRHPAATVERAIMRLTGLDLKMEQYARGVRFVASVHRAAGRAGLPPAERTGFVRQSWL